MFDNYNRIQLKENSKEPKVFSFSTSEKNPVPENPDQCGMICGSTSDRIIVVDFDGHKDSNTGVKEPVSIEYVEKVFPNLRKRTLVVQTTSGGKHGYFRIPENAEIPPRKHKAFSNEVCNIDILGEGGYVVLPPAKAENGEYEIISETTKIAELDYYNGIELRLLEFFPNKSIKLQEKDYGKIAKEGSKEGSRHDECLSLANHLKGSNPSWTEQTLLSALQDWANKSNYDDVEDIKRIVRDVFNHQSEEKKEEDKLTFDKVANEIIGKKDFITLKND